MYIPELGMTFKVQQRTRLFACQNPLHQGGGRKGLPKSFLNRFTQVSSVYCWCTLLCGDGLQSHTKILLTDLNYSQPDYLDRDTYTKNSVAPTKPLCIATPGLYRSTGGAWKTLLLNALPYLLFNSLPPTCMRRNQSRSHETRYWKMAILYHNDS